MKIFIVSHTCARLSRQQLVSQLSVIEVKPRAGVPVIVVSDRYNLDELCAHLPPVDCVSFTLEELQAEPAILYQHMGTDDRQWLLIDFSLKEEALGIEFITRLARCNYLQPELRQRNLVFMAPELYLSTLAKICNESFNNLPVCNDSHAQRKAIRKLLLLSHLKRLQACVPLPGGIKRRLYHVLRSLYRRLRVG